MSITKLAPFILCFCISNSCAQRVEIVKEYYSPEELKEDFAVFRTSLEEGHPALYRYKSRPALDSIFAFTEASISKQMSDREFTQLLSKLAAQIGDGHLRVILPKTHKDKLDEGPTALPFRMYYYEGKLFITKNLSELPDKEIVGAEIISINGHSMEEFLKEYFSMVASDGNNLTNKYRMLQRPRFFPRYFNILYGYTEEYEIVVMPLGETVPKTFKFRGITIDQLIKIQEKRNPLNTLASFNLSANKDYAYMAITSFDKSALKENNINFEDFVEKSFRRLSVDKINNLILDLRGNGGGTDEYGKILFSYFTNQSFIYYESVRINKESFNFFKYTSRPDMRVPKGMVKANNLGTFDNIKHPNVGIQKPSQPTYTGNIYVLIDGSCFSTTSEFLSMLHFHTKAVFIGEESGGGYYGNSSGATPEFTLPNTKVSIEIPLMNYTMAVKGYSFPDRGIIPDHTIIPSVEDKIENRDIVLEFATSLKK